MHIYCLLHTSLTISNSFMYVPLFLNIFLSFSIFFIFSIILSISRYYSNKYFPLFYVYFPLFLNISLGLVYFLTCKLSPFLPVFDTCGQESC